MTAVGRPERYRKMLAETQGVDIDLAKLGQIADEDLTRNTKAIEEAAHAIERAIRNLAPVDDLTPAERSTLLSALDGAPGRLRELRELLARTPRSPG